MEGRGERREEKGLGGKSTLEMEKELRGREGSGERETMPFLLTNRSHSILECWLRGVAGCSLCPQTGQP